MRWTNSVTLIRYGSTATNADGVPIQAEENRVAVFCSVESVGRTEFYQAAQAGYTAKLICIIYAAEYNNAQVAIIDGVRYGVTRAYNKHNGDYLELTLSDLAERNA